MQKKNTRREFLEKGIKLGVAVPVMGSFLWACKSGEESNNENAKEPKKLKILILGGTSFLGPHQIAYALDRGHEITTFTRGKTKATVHQELFDQVTMLVGDRANDLTALETGEWDVVIDNSGHNEKWTKDTANLLKDRAGLYMYTSSTGVYYPYLTSNVDEDFEVLMENPDDPDNTDRTSFYWYGVMKSNSERLAREAFGDDRTIVVRPTYMFGPADRTNRFIHWPIRLSQGGEILVPGKANDPVQYVDVRDVAEFMIRLAEEKTAGTFNAVGPKEAQNMYQFVEEASTAFEVEHTFVNIDDYDFLRKNGLFYIVPWILPQDEYTASALIDNSKGVAAGLTFRPLKETVKDTYDWWYSDNLTEEQRKTFEDSPQASINVEKTVLEAWKTLSK